MQDIKTNVGLASLSREQYVYFGKLFLIFQLIAVVRNLASDFYSFYWFCDFASGLFALALFSRKPQIVKAVIHIGLVPQVGYFVIMIAKIFFNINLFGFVIDFPLEAQYIIPTLIVHASTITALLVTFKIKPRLSSLAYSVVALALIWLTVVLYSDGSTNAMENYNYVYTTSFFSRIGDYTDMWIPIVFVVVVIPTYLLELAIYHEYKFGRIRNRIKSLFRQDPNLWLKPN